MKALKNIICLLTGTAIFFFIACKGEEPLLPLEPKDKTKTEKPEKHDPVEPGEKKPGSEHNVPPSTSGEGKPGSENDDPPTIPGEGAPGGNENGGRPEDVLLGRRMVAQWRAESGYKELFDLDGLFIRREKEKFDAAYMNRFVLFASSAAEGKGRYLLTDRDMDKLQILDIRFDAPANTITFWTSYNGIKSDAPMALGFSKELYYAAKLTVNRNRTADLYLHGVANNLSLFLNSLLEYDTERYAVIAEG